ncbi:MAG: hypothetical protein JRI25_17425 [Deltaproteobacteria bacterium]|nr:hypothetical protein [Deltaproteobacteria bacterium]
MNKIYEPKVGSKWGPVYGPLRDELVAAYPNIDAPTITAIIEDPTHDPLFYFPDLTIQLTVVEPFVGMGNNMSIIEVLFATEDGPHVFHENASRGRYTWDDVFFGQSTR